MPLGTEVGIGPGHMVLYGDAASPPLPRKGGGRAAPNFRPMSIVAKRLNGCQDLNDKMPVDTEIGLGRVVLDGDPTIPSPERDTAAPIFLPTSIVAKRLDGSRCHLVRMLASAQATLY